MGFPNIGKYQIGRTLGQGKFAKVKLAVDTTSGHYAAVKIIDKHMVMESDLMYQVRREIRTMKTLDHPNIVCIHEVIGTKTKIYIVMEYVAGGQISDKMLYAKRSSEMKARKLFQQLLDAVDHCHSKCVYHRDLMLHSARKLLDCKGNLKVSDLGLSAPHKPGDLLSTARGSPSYVEPELLVNKAYDGAAADIWSCGVILFELLAGYLPFDDRNLKSLYTKISTAQYTCSQWFTQSQKKLISRILEPDSRKRITIPEIIDDEWFRKDYIPSRIKESDKKIYFNDIDTASIEEKATKNKMPRSSRFINAFQLIAMSKDLDLSGLFEEEMRMHKKQKMSRCARSSFELSAEVIEVAPTNCVVEISKSAGELGVYKEV